MKQPIVVYLPKELAEHLRKQKNDKKIKSISGEIRGLVIKKYGNVSQNRNGQKTIFEYFK